MTTATQTFSLSAIGQIFIRARDLDRAVHFYRDTLGMPFLFQAPPQMAFFQCGATTVMLGVPEAPELDHPASLVYYLVPDIAAAHTALRGRGVEFISEPHLVHRAADYDLWLADFRDSGGKGLARAPLPQRGDVPLRDAGAGPPEGGVCPPGDEGGRPGESHPPAPQGGGGGGDVPGGGR